MGDTLRIEQPANLVVNELFPREELWSRLDVLYRHLLEGQKECAEIASLSCRCALDTSHHYDFRNEIIQEIQTIKSYLYTARVQFPGPSPTDDGKEA